MDEDHVSIQTYRTNHGLWCGVAFGAYAAQLEVEGRIVGEFAMDEADLLVQLREDFPHSHIVASC